MTINLPILCVAIAVLPLVASPTRAHACTKVPASNISLDVLPGDGSQAPPNTRIWVSHLAFENVGEYGPALAGNLTIERNGIVIAT